MCTTENLKAFWIEPLKFRMFPIRDGNCVSLSRPLGVKTQALQIAVNVRIQRPCSSSSLSPLCPLRGHLQSLCNLVPSSIHRNLLNTSTTQTRTQVPVPRESVQFMYLLNECLNQPIPFKARPQHSSIISVFLIKTPKLPSTLNS